MITMIQTLTTTTNPYEFAHICQCKNMYSVAISIAPGHQTKKEKWARAETNTDDYNDMNFEQKMTHASLHTFANEKQCTTLQFLLPQPSNTK